MTEHLPGGGDWDDPEAEPDEDDERAAQAEDPTSVTRGFEDAEDVEEFDAETEDD